MKDKWMNINYENDDLRPYEEPTPDFSDKDRIGSFDFLRRLLLTNLTRRFPFQKASHVIVVTHAIKSSTP